jgi:prepilin-type N-terminal cleavage/methylation domain-containing protein
MNEGAFCPSPRGFTLVEVLIGVVVLGLGLLGLAAIFPAVVVQQRAASEAIEGPSLVGGVRAYVASSSQFNANSVTTVSHPGGSAGPFPPGAIRALLQVESVSGTPRAFGDDGRWVIPVPEGDGGDYALEIDDRGNLTIFGRFRVPGTFEEVRYRISALDRLIPSVASIARVQSAELAGANEAEPRYVWDAMIRRIMSSDPTSGMSEPSEGDALQMAVFIRRIDVGIRRPPGGSLVDALRPLNGVAPEVVAVAADNQEGRALLNGRGDYSLIFEATLTRATDEPEQERRWEIPDGARFDGIRQVGQKLVTVDGRVLTVSRVVNDGSQTLVEFENDAGPLGAAGDDFDVWYTPQVPVAVDVFNLQSR